ncbi:MAG: hypothetical protein V1835_00935 [Candidatus Micrarchaeota archaeon]
MKIALLLMIVFGFALFGCTSNTAGNSTATPTEQPTEKATATPTELSTTTPTATKAPQATETGGLTDCGSDFDCFIKASENCGPTKVNYIYATDMFGVKQTTENYFELRGMTAGKCLFYIKLVKTSLVFPSQVPQQTVDEQKAMYDKLAGRDGTCKFLTTDLTALLERWKAGTFSMSSDMTEGDWAGAECEGEYFSQTLE